ncbi:MAG: Fic family protein [Chloroflexi bacterium]|nr:Fic family protein [Chloroflexota bacterium]
MGSHEFIRFPPYEVKLTVSLVMLLAEIQSQIRQIGQIPILPSVRDELRTVYLARAAYGTTSIEGNTMTEDAVLSMARKSIEEVLPADYEEQEVVNVLAALNSIAKATFEGNTEPFSSELLNQYHKSLVAETGSPNCDEDEIGAIRKKSVEVGRYLGAPPQDCPRLLRAYCEWLNERAFIPIGQEAYELAWQIVKAITAHIYFAWIHPYCDGNGRLARLIESKVLLDAGIPDIAAHLLSNLYNKRRSEYIKELQDSHGDYNEGSYASEARVQDFIEFALRGFRDELESQCLEIYNSQLTVMWHDLIHVSFPRKLSDAQQRRKRLALDLTHPPYQQSVPFGEIRELTPAVAVAYVNESDQTIRNDLKVLVKMGLVQRDDTGYRPNTEIMTGFF